MARRGRDNRAGKEAANVALVIAGLFVLVVLGLGFPKTSQPSSGSASSVGATTYAPPSSSPAVAYAALPADPPVAIEPKSPSLFEQDIETKASPWNRSETSTEKRYISGHKVPLRSEARVGSAILDKFGPGRVVGIIESGPTWTRVRDETTQREGWVPTKRLTDREPTEEKKAPAPPALPSLSVAAIAKLLIAESIAEYPGPCACPYQSARNGSSCGRRAAYSRPGGYAPLCYAHDVTPAMVASYRERQQEAVASR